MVNKKLDDVALMHRNGSNRLLAIDAVRGLAVIGMFIQHFALHDFTNFVSGNTMILFILCSGVSYTMMAQSMERKSIKSTVFRARVLARAVFIDLVGYLILMLNGPFGVVLQAYAMLFVLALLLVKCSTKVLLIVSAIGFVVCPPLMLIGMSLFENIALLSDIAGGPLSALAWLPVFVTGMIVGRLNLHHVATAVRLAIVGIAILIPVKLFALFVLPEFYQSFWNWSAQLSSEAISIPDPYAVWPKNTLAPLWHMLFIDAPQGGSSFELLIGTGGNLILLAVILLLEKKISLVLKLLAKVGQTALTLYSVQFIIAWILMLIGINPTAIGQFPFGDIVTSIFVLFIGCLISLLKNPPLETAIRKFERLFYTENETYSQLAMK